MTILNMVGGGTSGPKVPLNAISVIAAVGGDTEATITWTDPSDLVVNGVIVTTWSSTKLVRKVGSAPTDSTDGTLVVTETVRDTYSSTGYNDTGLTNGATYYYAAFAVGNNGLETISSTTPDVTPAQGGWTPGANTIAYYPLNGNANDESGNGYNGTWGNGAYYATGVDGQQCADFSRANDTWITSNCKTAPKTLAFFMKWKDLNATTQDRRQIIGMTSTWSNGWAFRAIPTNYNSAALKGQRTVVAGGEQNYTNTSIVDTNWHHFCFVSDTNTKFYVDGTLLNTYSGQFSNSGNYGLTIGQVASINNNSLNGYMQHIILESVAWTEQDIADYLSNFSY